MLSQAEPNQKQTTAAITKCLELHLAYIGKHVTCRAARPFLPALLDPHLKIRIPTPITAHLDNCEQCCEDLEAIRKLDLDRNRLWQLAQILTGQPTEDSSIEQADMQQLQEMASQIAEQPESGVVTTYTIDKSAKTEVSSESNNPYASFPVRVEVVGSKSKAYDKPPASNYKRMLKPAIAVAAAILIAVGLLINAPTAGAATIGQIYKAIEKIKNVYIAKFDPQKKEPKQELWVSREFNLYMTKTGNEMILWDIDNGLRKTKSPETGGIIETSQITEKRMIGIEKKRSGLGLVPFESMPDIPFDHGWDEVTDKYPQAAAEGLEVYELRWTSKRFDGSDEFWKWRFYIDPKTYLPNKTECYRKLSTEKEYTLQSVNVVKYLDSSEIQAALKSGGF